MDLAPPFVREVGIDGGSDEVVDDAERASLFHDQARPHQLRSRSPQPILRPAPDGHQVLDRGLSTEHGDRLEEHHRLSACSRQTVGNDARDIGVDVPSLGQQLAPERPAARPVGDCRRGLSVQSRVHRASDVHRRVMVEWSERHPRQPVADQSLQGSHERAHRNGPPTAHEQREGITVYLGLRTR